MLDRLLSFKEYLLVFNQIPTNKANKCDSLTALNEMPDGWLILEQLFKCMEPIRLIEQVMEGDMYMTIGLALPILCDLHRKLYLYHNIHPCINIHTSIINTIPAGYIPVLLVLVQM